LWLYAEAYQISIMDQRKVVDMFGEDFASM